jgi:alpha-L-fucosidase 2
MEEYQPACDLMLQMNSLSPAEEYSRALDLAKGIAKVAYRAGAVKYKRICFVSAVDDVFVMHLKADHKKAISATMWLEREISPECCLTNQAQDHCLILNGKINNGTSFEVKAKIIIQGGTISSSDSQKSIVSEADEMLILVSITTDRDCKDAGRILSDTEDINSLLKKHTIDHEKIYRRAAFSLKTNNKEKKSTTDQLLHSAFIGKPDKSLFEMMFNMGRYLMIAGSRPGTMAMHLQGIWNNKLHPPWQSDWHLDVNVQMNYWLAEVGNLSEFAMPLFDMIKSLIPDGEKNAKNFFACRGVVFPIAFAGEGSLLPGAWVAWTGAAGWLAQHLYWHYEYTLDNTFLEKTAYPYMKKVAEFYEDFLIKDKSGRYMVVPSLSPENTPLERGNDEKGKWEGHKTICTNATMDIAIIRELLENLLKASIIIGRDAGKQKIWREILDNLPDWPVDKNGMLKEWVDETNLDNHNHRHFSHLYPLFPGNMFCLEDTPELAQAAGKAFHARQISGYANNAGWSYPYMAMFHARLGEGDKALQCLTCLAGSCMMNNLLTIHNDWRFQGLSLYWALGDRAFMIDAILGAAAAIAEMLLQSHNNLIRILPALPESWDTGKIKGLRARGGFEIDIEWKAGITEKVKIHSLSGMPCSVKLCQPYKRMKLKCGTHSVKATQINNGLIQFDTEKGGIYEMNNK